MVDYSHKEVIEIMEKLPNVTGYKEIDNRIIINKIKKALDCLLKDPEVTKERERFVKEAGYTKPEDFKIIFMSPYA